MRRPSPAEVRSRKQLGWKSVCNGICGVISKANKNKHRSFSGIDKGIGGYSQREVKLTMISKSGDTLEERADIASLGRHMLF
jgi:hypothetical protein